MRVVAKRSIPSAPSTRRARSSRGASGRSDLVALRERPRELEVEGVAVTPGRNRDENVIDERTVKRAFEVEQSDELASQPEYVVAKQIAVHDAGRKLGIPLGTVALE